MNDKVYKFKRRILLAEESRIMRRAVLRILEEGFDVDEVDDGIDALTRLHAQQPYSMLITSFELPNLSGLGVVERLRDSREARLRSMPVIVIDSENEEHRDRILSIGSTDFVSKPFDSRQFLDRVHALLRTAPGNTGIQRAVEVEEEAESMLDKLTGLPNQAYFNYRGDKDLSFAKRHEKDMAVILIQMDRFDDLVKEVGRPISMQLVKKLAKYVKNAVRNEDNVCRTGECEFAVVALMTDEFGAKVMADRVIKKVRSTFFRYGEQELSFTISVGLAAPRVNRINQFIEIAAMARKRLELAVKGGGNRLAAGQRETRQEPAVNDENMAAEAARLIRDKQTRHVTEPVPAITDAQIAAAAAGLPIPRAEPEAPPNDASRLEVALWLLRHAETNELSPNYRDLLNDLMPLLEQADKSLQLGLTESIGKLKSGLG